MTFIDWSDSEGVFGLLIEFVTDEKNESIGDVSRQRFLTELLVDLNAANDRFDAITAAEAFAQLRVIHDSIHQEFKDDPVVVHIRDCMEELERIN